MKQAQSSLEALRSKWMQGRMQSGMQGKMHRWISEPAVRDIHDLDSM